ncbi:sugar ABC transporter substrate-binding protein [Cumulibacter soli]|uniref:sugar ABC transporter substrate-binding protein n=1 Tax=Cumulibacter soli TaxID=2546344 RepID=UPI00106778D9|nr:sugar ABC transporter substrate-binding protein [Cumulibacter soli]
MFRNQQATQASPPKTGVRRVLICLIAVATLLLGACTSTGPAPTSVADVAEGGGLPDTANPDEVADYVHETLKGKKVAYAAGASGFPLQDVWRNTFIDSFEQLGIEFTYNDAQADPQKLVQNAQTLINDDPDVLILHNQDLTNAANLIKDAQAKGIYVIVINLASVAQSDAFVGGNFGPAQTALAERMSADCAAKGKKDIAIIQGWSSDGLSVQAVDAWKAVFEAEGMNVVSEQAGQYDPTKAFNIATTVLQQQDNLCGFIGAWDSMMIGAANAVDQAGLAGEVGVYTSDASIVACDAIEAGTMTAAVDYGVMSYGPTIVAMVQYFLESGIPAGTTKNAVFAKYTVIDETNLHESQGSCYTGDSV